jgi:hypothetical protein
VPPARRADAIVVASLALALGCAAAVPSVGLRPMDLPAAVAPRDLVSSRLDAGLPALLRALSERGREGYRALRLNGAQMDGWLSPDAITRGRNTFVGMVPGSADHRWFAWRRWRGSALLGWCARGVRVDEANGPEGFVRRTLLVERLLVVGGRGDQRWAAWLEGLMLSRDGWRFAPWVPHAQSVEAPRRSHPDIELWDCDVARSPATSARPPGG